MEDDGALLERFRGGDRPAGEALFERYFDALYRFFEPKVAANDVGDLVQRTFLGCVETAERFRGEASVRTLVYRIAKNQLQDYYRKRYRAPTLDFGVSSVEALGPSPTSILRRKERDELLERAMRRIPLELALTLELHYLEGLRGPELARVLEIPEGTVRSRLRRALEAVRREVERLEAPGPARDSTLSGIAEWDREAVAS
ncbi:MAG: sigma-70 family RNA polymerase sigma factor [Myxococcales bacterium]|nr:sigma-70 family RNA polymerase sigma factor [Myxococcales bacterium]